MSDSEGVHGGEERVLLLVENHRYVLARRREVGCLDLFGLSCGDHGHSG